MGGCVILKSTLLYHLNIAGVILLAPLCGVNDDLLPSQRIINFMVVTSKYFQLIK